MPLSMSPLRLLGSRNSSRRSTARGLRREKNSSSHHAPAATAPKMATCMISALDIKDVARIAVISDSNVDDFANDQGAKQLHQDAADEHFLAQRVGEEQHQIVG